MAALIRVRFGVCVVNYYKSKTAWKWLAVDCGELLPGPLRCLRVQASQKVGWTWLLGRHRRKSQKREIWTTFVKLLFILHFTGVLLPSMVIAQPIPELAGILLPSGFYADLWGLEEDILPRLAVVGWPLNRHLHALIRIAITSKVCPIINHRPTLQTLSEWVRVWVCAWVVCGVWVSV